MSADSPAQVVWRDVGHVLEVARTRREAGRPSEVVDGDRIHARLGEPQRQLLVERVQAADVGQDDDAGAGRIGRRGRGRR